MKNFPFLAGLLLLSVCRSALADSATWSGDPISDDWNTVENWTPATVPGDTATFALSNTTDVSVSFYLTYVRRILFAPGASAFTITALPGSALVISGSGIANNSGIQQNFAPGKDETGNVGEIIFFESASAGTLTTFTNVSSGLQFQADSSAGTSIVNNNGGTVDGGEGGFVGFYDRSKAENAIINNYGGQVSGAPGGWTYFSENSSGGNAVVTCYGATVNGGIGGLVQFVDLNTHAGSATVIANSGTNGGGGGMIQFLNRSVGELCRIEVFGNGSLDLSLRTAGAGLTIGSLEGDGAVFLGGQRLTLGANDLSTTYSGVAQDGGKGGGNGGSLSKAGIGALTLSGPNTYTGGTTLSDGVLIVNNAGASGTGSGKVQVDAGTLGGNGIIAGTVTVGTGSGAGALLAPGKGASNLITLRIQSALTLKADATYSYRLNAGKVKADKVVANGTTIENGARFKFLQLGQGQLTSGTVFVAISNTSANPIGGAFANLPDGSTFTAGQNKFQASYEGGTGNDLTLTVVP